MIWAYAWSEWRFINVRWVSVLQRSPTHWAVLESINSGRVTAIRTTKVGWRDMRRQREKRFLNKKKPLFCCRGGTASSRVRNWVVVLKGRTPLRLKPHCFSSTRWYFLSVGPLRASGWSTGGGERECLSSTAADYQQQHMEMPRLLPPCQARNNCNILERQTSPVVRSWRAEGCSGWGSPAPSVSWNKIQMQFWLARVCRDPCNTGKPQLVAFLCIRVFMSFRLKMGMILHLLSLRSVTASE